MRFSLLDYVEQRCLDQSASKWCAYLNTIVQGQFKQRHSCNGITLATMAISIFTFLYITITVSWVLHCCDAIILTNLSTGRETILWYCTFGTVVISKCCWKCKACLKWPIHHSAIYWYSFGWETSNVYESTFNIPIFEQLWWLLLSSFLCETCLFLCDLSGSGRDTVSMDFGWVTALEDVLRSV